MTLSARLSITAIAILVWPAFGQAANLTPTQAAAHIGERATVCGKIASGHYTRRSRGHPTFLDFERPYPAETFTAVIWGENRTAFGMPERALLGERVCVTGRIRAYRGRPEIVLRKPDQLSEQ